MASLTKNTTLTACTQVISLSKIPQEIKRDVISLAGMEERARRLDRAMSLKRDKLLSVILCGMEVPEDILGWLLSDPRAVGRADRRTEKAVRS